MNLGLTYTVGGDGSKVMSMPDETREWVISFVRENARKSPAGLSSLRAFSARERPSLLDSRLHGSTEKDIIGR